MNSVKRRRLSLNFFSKNLTRNFFLSCVLFPYLLSHILTLRNFRDPINLQFDDQSGLEFKIELETLWGPRTRVIDTKKGYRSPIKLYQSKIRSIEVSQAPSTPKVKANFDDGINQEIVFTKISEGHWKAPDLNIEKPNLNEGYFEGSWVFLGLVLSAIFWASYFLLRFRSYRKEILFFLSFLGLFAVLLKINWPGHISFDTVLDFQNALIGWNNSFTQFLFSALHTGIILYFPSLGLPAIINIIFAAATLTYVYRIVGGNRRSFLIFVGGLLMFLGSKINQNLIIHQNRDILFSWVFLLLLISLQQDISKKKRGLSILPLSFFVLSCFLRKDTLFLYPFIVGVDYYLGRERVKNARLRQRHFFITSMLAFYFMGTPYLRRIHMEPAYEITAYINPTMHILKKRGLEALTLEDREQLSSFVDLQKAIELHRDFDIDSYNLGAFNKGALSPEQVKAFRKATFRLLCAYPGDWLENRWQMAKAILGLIPETHWYFDEILRRNLMDPLLLTMPTPAVADGRDYLRPVYAARELTWYRWTLASCLPALLISLFLLGRFRRHPGTSFATLLVVLRVLVILTLAPAGYYKYVWSFTIWAWFAPSLATSEETSS
jgi:hypothetical protein